MKLGQLSILPGGVQPSFDMSGLHGGAANLGGWMGGAPTQIGDYQGAQTMVAGAQPGAQPIGQAATSGFSNPGSRDGKVHNMGGGHRGQWIMERQFGGMRLADLIQRIQQARQQGQF